MFQLNSHNRLDGKRSHLYKFSLMAKFQIRVFLVYLLKINKLVHYLQQNVNINLLPCNTHTYTIADSFTVILMKQDAFFIFSIFAQFLRLLLCSGEKWPSCCWLSLMTQSNQQLTDFYQKKRKVSADLKDVSSEPWWAWHWSQQTSCSAGQVPVVFPDCFQEMKN